MQTIRKQLDEICCIVHRPVLVFTVHGYTRMRKNGISGSIQNRENSKQEEQVFVFVWLMKYRMVVSLRCLPDGTRRWNTVQGKVNLPCTVVKKLFLGITVRIEWICFKENGILD